MRDSGVKIIIVAMGNNPNMPFLRLLADKGKIVRAPYGKIPAKKAVQISCKAPGTVRGEQRGRGEGEGRRFRRRGG